MKIEEFVLKSRIFIEEERNAEQQEYFSLYQKFNNKELEDIGLAINDVQIKKLKSAFFKKTILVFQKRDSSPFPKSLKIKVNDNVLIADRKNKEDVNIKEQFKGVVYRLRNDSIHILLEEKVAKLSDQQFGPSTCILKSGDNITFER